MLAPPAAVPRTWRRCDALFVVADGIGQALQGPANEMRGGKSQCSKLDAQCWREGRCWTWSISPSAAVWFVYLLPSHTWHTPSPSKREKRSKESCYWAEAVDPAAAYRADLAGVASRARQRDKDGWGAGKCQCLIDSKSVIMTIISLSLSLVPCCKLLITSKGKPAKTHAY
ncbi:hypothetical protein GGI43DRAFT_325682 [Trichoderma evansii]